MLVTYLLTFTAVDDYGPAQSSMQAYIVKPDIRNGSISNVSTSSLPSMSTMSHRSANMH